MRLVFYVPVLYKRLIAQCKNFVEQYCHAADFVAVPKILSQIFAYNTELSREKRLSLSSKIKDCSISCFCFLCLDFCLCVLLRFAVVVCLLLYFCCFVLYTVSLIVLIDNAAC